MIVKEYGKQAVYCDGCGEKLGTFESFEEAREAIANAGWTTHRIGAQWSNCCPECSTYMQEEV